VIEPPKPDIVCSQVITERDFSGQVKVSSKAIIFVYLNDKRIN